MKKIALMLGILLALLPNASYASFINNYNDWSKLSDSQKSAYGYALWDQAMNIGNADDPNYIALTTGLTNCQKAVNFDGAMISAAIDRYYRLDQRHLKYAPPNVFYTTIVFGTCREDINKERVAKHLETVK